MYNVLKGLVVLFCVLFGSFAHVAAKENPSPAIHIENPDFDFGQVPRGKLVRHQFKVFNKGTAPLEIQKVQPD